MDAKCLHVFTEVFSLSFLLLLFLVPLDFFLLLLSPIFILFYGTQNASIKSLYYGRSFLNLIIWTKI